MPHTQALTQLDAVVLAGGKGSRFGSKLKPKVLHTLLGKPILFYVLDALKAAFPLRRIVVVGFHLLPQLQEALAEWQRLNGLPVELIDQEDAKGTGHALWQAAQKSTQPFTANVVVASGDVPLLQVETWQALASTFYSTQAAMSLLTANLPEGGGAYGRVLTELLTPPTRSAEGKVLKLVEANQASEAEQAITLVNAGAYLLNWLVVEPVLTQLASGWQAKQNTLPNGEWPLTELPNALNQRQATCTHFTLQAVEEMQGINTREELSQCVATSNRSTQKRLMAQGVTIIDPAACWIGPDVELGADTIVYPGTLIEGKVSVGENCQLGPHSTLIGPLTVASGSSLVYAHVKEVVVGENNHIGPFSRLRDNVITGANNRIGNFVELKNLTLGNDNFVSHFSFLGDAEMGDRVNVGAGTMVANFNYYTKEKHRTHIGNDISIGCNTVLVAPLTLEAHSAIAAGSVITNTVAAYDLAVARARQVNLPGWVQKQLAKLPERQASASFTPLQQPLSATVHLSSNGYASRVSESAQG
jgi:bifunctional UDP-N-acetylglucosamine pyrophosphorylase / glucosamine-1-phosphate N-acetyltransferase